MPELPEVETIARTLSPQILDRRILSLELLRKKTLQAGHAWLPRLQGARISRVHRRAKLLLLDLDLPPDAPLPRLCLLFHLKMTGSFFVHPAGAAALKHTRIIFDLDGSPGSRLFFDDIRTFGYCRIAPPESLPDWPFWKSLGPEPLLCPIPTLARRFLGRAAAIKAVLLNQTVIAGIGNIYADEALFQAGIHPATKASRLPFPALESLARSLQDILIRAIAQCGSSIRDYRDALGNAGAFQNTFAVYGRKGQACIRCGVPLLQTRIAGRTTVYCPRCQPETSA
ncbi:MAG: bifunctional DNA-formamidopyrimidine glycosylase/DNA-(apurinic or apyrimidinic site) lyase [Desulfovibrio sp.]|jgi:formamidopyrimidine-DNA glycosylase|nr:bifunctional DNA-formamidopyrimidine glycosylase/DNA-(apurinic or apyrimidinic site) lyase [Desulfovibrio sp.]